MKIDRFGIQGIIYLIHFNQPFGHAEHYLGWTSYGHLEQRLYEHRRGRGSNLVKHVNLAGITWQLGRVWWDVDRHQERRWKVTSHKPRCWICSPPRRVPAATKELMDRWMGYEVPWVDPAAVDAGPGCELRVPVQAAG